MPPPRTFRSADRMIECAYVPGVFVSFLPVSMFGNAYTYVVGQVRACTQSLFERRMGGLCLSAVWA
eukprot:176025-Chlamydomonas_euryale.AAC.1